ncbi:MAG: GtrA family protein [Gammaproteobacteria bacterium]|nr:MAG: GtrA family protein [Gammaproteobacteria bacterium]
MKLNKALQKQFLIFLCVGVMNTIFGYSIFAFFIFLNTPYYLALLFAAVLGLMFNFITTGRIVFKNKRFCVFYKFIMINTLLYFIHITLIKFINRSINNFYISGLLTMSLTSILSFYLNKRIFSIKVNINNREILDETN